MVQKYKRPPITEAVIEVRLRSPIDADLLDKLLGRLAEEYPLPPQRTVNLNVEFSDTSAKVKPELSGYRLTALDGAGIVSITPISIATSRLAPYEGWEPFTAQARRNWEVWKRAVGWREIARVGVRYINRIDVPNPTGEPFSIEDYLNIAPRLPDIGVGQMMGFAVNSVAPLGKDDLHLILNASTAPGILVKTVSFIVDLDLSRDTALPQNDDGLWAFVDKIREHKNIVFEACITDKAKELFDR